MRFTSILLLISLLAGMVSMGHAQSRMMLGVNAGALALAGGDGFLFRGQGGAPHREFGWSLGASMYIPLDDDLHLILGLSMQQEHSHFHLDKEGGNTGKADLPTGDFFYRYYQMPITLNHMGLPKGRSKIVLKEFFGFAFNYGNLRDPVSAPLEGSDYTYTSRVSQPFKIMPEFMIGAGVATRPMKFGFFHYQASVHIDLLKNQTFEASINNPAENDYRVEIREIRGVKAMVSIIYFPMIHFKKNTCYRN